MSKPPAFILLSLYWMDSSLPSLHLLLVCLSHLKDKRKPRSVRVLLSIWNIHLPNKQVKQAEAAAAAAAAAMILNSINPHSASKLDQIMSRYRPIAPKPQIPITPGTDTTSSSPPETITQKQQTKPRSRKRGKYGISSAIRKRAKTNNHFPGSYSSSSPYGVASLAKNTQLGLSLQGFGHGYPQFPPPLFPGPLVSRDLEMGTANLVRLPFLPYTSSSSHVPELHCMNPYPQMNENSAAETLKEMDLLQNLHGPSVGLSTPQPGCGRNIIAPQAVRPVGSSIRVRCISEDPNSNHTACVSKRPEEVEAEVESDALPVVVSDSNNKVRLANSAFKEMVGQPECLWLDSMATCNEQSRGSACKRISGGVILDLSNSPVPVSSNGFSCRVSIEWGNKEQKSSINAPCDVMKLSCAAKDYLFTWRIHTREAFECNSKA